MNPSGSVRWWYVLQVWVAFCSGWWLVGVILGLRHFIDLLARPSPGVLEAAGVSLVIGGLLPGGVPFWYAADVVGVRGLPVGFTGFLIGAVITITVWVTLPLALSIDSRLRTNQDATGRSLIAAAIPYVAAGPGLVQLFRTYRTRGWTRLGAGTLALTTAALAYLIGAVIIFAFGTIFLY